MRLWIGTHIPGGYGGISMSPRDLARSGPLSRFFGRIFMALLMAFVFVLSFAAVFVVGTILNGG
jgi:hypothetical protein